MVKEWSYAIFLIKQEPPVRAQDRTNKLNRAVFIEQVWGEQGTTGGGGYKLYQRDLGERNQWRWKSGNG